MTLNDGLTDTKILSLAMSPTFAINGYTFVGTRDGIYKMEKNTIDNQAPESAITEPTGEDTVTSSSLLIKGISTDNIAISKVNISIKREADNYYFSPQEFDWTPTPTAIETVLTTTDNSQTAEWQYIWDVPLCDAKRINITSQAIDVAGNLQITSSTLDVIIDNADLKGSFLIEDGKAYATETTVTTTNSVSQANLMRFSTDDTETWSDWEIYSTAKQMSLALGDGTKTIKAEFKRTSDARVFSVQDDIILDTQAPIAGIISPANDNQVEGTATISAISDDAISGTAYVEFYVNSQKIGEVSAAPYQLDWDTTQEINGPCSIYIIAVDNAGNMVASNPVQANVENPIPYVAAKRIKDFLLLGPVKNSNAQNRLSIDYFAEDGSPSENNVHPMLFDDSIKVLDSQADSIDLNSYLTNTTECATYANVYINSPVSHSAMLSLGTTGGIKAWVNGEVAVEKDTERMFALDEDTATISLKAGWNQLLIKTTNGTSSEYKFSAKISDFDGAEIPEFIYQLDNPFPPILFEDNFNQTGTSLGEFWESADTVIEDGELRCEGSFISAEDVDEYSYSDIYGHRQADYSVSFNLMFYPNQTEDYDAYLLLRAIDINNGYEFGITDSGAAAFYKKVNGARTQIGPSVVLPVEFNHKYNIEIKVISNTLTILADSLTVLRVTDLNNTFAQPGKVGFETVNTDYIGDLKITPLDSQAWTIRGTITNALGSPVSNVAIIASTASDNNTDVQEFAGTVAGDGSYVIEVPDISDMSLSLYIKSQAYSAKTMEDIDLSAENPEETLDIVLSNTATINGSVIDDTGAPVSEALVSPIGLTAAYSADGASTDDTGTFTIAGIDAPESYSLLVDANGYTSQVLDTTVTFDPGDNISLPPITLHLAGKISGMITDPYGNPIMGATVIASTGYDEDKDRSATADENGNYTIEDLDIPDVYYVTALADGYEVSTVDATSVAEGQTIEGVNLVMGIAPAYGARSSARIEGRNWIHSVGNNESYDPDNDTHQWLTFQATQILQNDSRGRLTYNRLESSFNEQKLWYWVARGVRRADSIFVKNQGYSKDHMHNLFTHTGSLSWKSYIDKKFYAMVKAGELTNDSKTEYLALLAELGLHIGDVAANILQNLSSPSAADYAQTEFNKALALWQSGKKDESMYYLGLALHHVQDLRVPQHNSNLLPNHNNKKEYLRNGADKGIEAYYNDVKDNWVAKDTNGNWEPAIFGDTFEKKWFVHQDPDTAYGWVDRSAHISYRWISDACFSSDWEAGYDRTKDLFKSTQRFSAGFLKFFFDEVQKSPRPKMIKVVITWDKPMFNPDIWYENYSKNLLANNNTDIGLIWGLEDSKIDDPVLTNKLNNRSYIINTVYHAVPNDGGTYRVGAVCNDIDNTETIHGTATVYIDGLEVDTILSPPIRKDEYDGKPYWEILSVDEPSGEVHIINKVIQIYPPLPT